MFIDAAYSKMADIKANAMLVCSKTGFDPIAIEKAKRTKIGLISILRRDDRRIKAVIEEKIYLRKVALDKIEIRLDFLTNEFPKHLTLEEVKYRGEPVSVKAWLFGRAALFTALNRAIGDRRLNLHYTLKKPTEFEFGNERVTLRGYGISFQPKVKWLSQIVRLDATAGIYDYVRGKVRLAQGNSYVVEGVNFNKATPLTSSPEIGELGVGLMPGEVDMSLTLLEPFPAFGKLDSRVLDSQVCPEDLIDRWIEKP